MTLKPFLPLLILHVLFSQAGWAQNADTPERPSGWQDRASVSAERQMVVTANSYASEAGLRMLHRGGSATDAAIAAQMVLNLVEPQSSGIGGGAFLVLWTASTRNLTTYDGRETAPAAAKPDRFLGADGKPLPFSAAVVGGRSVGVPGLLRMLEMAHRRHGRLPWADLFQPAIELAEQGFIVSPRLSTLIAADSKLAKFPETYRYFYDAQGKPRAAGTILKNLEFAETLRHIAKGGAHVFYHGKIADDIVATVQNTTTNPGDLTLQDLSSYRAIERPALCGSYRSYRICGMGPPSSGPLAVIQILNLAGYHGIDRAMPNEAKTGHLLAEASKLAFADRAFYLGDPAFVSVPVKGLLDPAYLQARAKLIRQDRALQKVEAGHPPMRQTLRFGLDASPEFASTSHLSIVDAQGNALSMTTTIENAFGSGLMVHGFLLNNELTDFSFNPEQAGQPVANRLEPLKRPRSSMSPLIVFDKMQKPYLVIGSPGGSAIINYVTRATQAILDHGLDPQQAVALPHIGNRGNATELERGTVAEGLKTPLEALGHQVSIAEMTSGTHAILIKNGLLIGGADPRREGRALGD